MIINHRTSYLGEKYYTMINMGPLGKSGLNTDFMETNYVVFEPHQVLLKYIVEVEFNFTKPRID
jgi:hypothetical protein